MRRDTVIIGGMRFVLAQGHSISEVREATVAALRSNGGLIDLVVHGNRKVPVLISPGVAVVFTSEDVDATDCDERDTGDIEVPFDSILDYEYL